MRQHLRGTHCAPPPRLIRPQPRQALLHFIDTSALKQTLHAINSLLEPAIALRLRPVFKRSSSPRSYLPRKSAPACRGKTPSRAVQKSGLKGHEFTRAATWAKSMRPSGPEGSLSADSLLDPHFLWFLQSSPARSSSAISNFFIFIMACIAFDVFRSSPMRAGVICQLRPNLSLSQPHATSAPPSVSFDQ